MITWKQACDSIGFNYTEVCPYNDSYIWFAYKEGKAIQCADRKIAEGISKNTERVKIENPDRAAWYAKFRENEVKAHEVWYNSMRQGYDHLSDKVFNICYSRAYDKGHHAGRDEVTNCMDDIADFADEIIDAVIEKSKQ